MEKLQRIKPSELPQFTIIREGEDEFFVKTGKFYWVPLKQHCLECLTIVLDDVSRSYDEEVKWISNSNIPSDEFFTDYQVISAPLVWAILNG